MKKIIVLILLSFLMTLILGCTAFADDDIYTQGKLYYRVDGESITIVGNYENSSVVEIPASISGLPVNTIASGAFIGNGNIKTLLLPDTITSVESNAVDTGIELVHNANVPSTSGTETTPSPSPEVTEDNTDDSGNEGNTTGTSDGGTGTTTTGETGKTVSGGTGTTTTGGTGTTTTGGTGTTTSGGASYSADVVLDEEGNAEILYQTGPSAAEEAEPTPEPTAEVSPSPEVTEPATTEEPTEKEAEPSEAKSSSAAVIIIVAVVAVIAAGAVIIAKKKK